LQAGITAAREFAARYNVYVMSDEAIPIPPANFEFLVWSLRMQAESSLGAAPWGGEKQEVNLPIARHSIDLLALLQDKTRNNLTLDEQRLLDNSVTELRFRFLQASEAEQEKPAEVPPEEHKTEENG
jgi:hypothetical protein